MFIEELGIELRGRLLDLWNGHNCTADQSSKYRDILRQKHAGAKHDLSRSVNSLIDEVERCVLISLDRREDRRKRVLSLLDQAKWPWEIEVFSAIDGRKLPLPEKWKQAGAGAYGCLLSHREVLTQARLQGLSCVCVLEDDALPVNRFSDRLAAFRKKLPADWDAVMLGGQHVRRPKPIADCVVQCIDTHRTHGYVIREPMLSELLRVWSAHIGHCDHAFGPMMGRWKVYAPSPFLLGQDEGKSDIRNAIDPKRFWG